VTNEARAIVCILVAWATTFIGLLVYWGIAESVEPGQQYADPLLPCLFMASLFGPVLGIFANLLIILADRSRDR